MAASVRTKARQTNERKERSRSAKTLLSGRSKSAGQGVQGAVRLSTKPKIATSLVIPVTHLAAGISVPISQTLKTRFGVGEHPVDGNFLESIETVFKFLQIALQQEWLTPVDVYAMLSHHSAGTPEQSKACYSLINKCLDHISEEARIILEPTKIAMATHGFQSGNGGGWEIIFGISSNRDESISSDSTPKLLAQEYGLCLMMHDISLIPESVRGNLIQFIYFCSSLSLHATSIDMILDDMLKWMILGDVAEVGLEAELELIASANDIEIFDEALKKHFGEDFIEDLFVSTEDIADYYLSYEEAKALFHNLKPLSKDNVRTFQHQISSSTDTPQWLLTATRLLLESCQWDVDMTEHIRVDGEIPLGFLKPFGFGLPIENHMFEVLHSISMHGEEASSISVEFGTQTAKVLANLELGESLLLFVEDNLHKANS